MRLCYAIGPITGLSYDDCTDWRRKVATLLAPDVTLVSPMRGKDYLRGEPDIGLCYEGTLMSNAQALTYRDRYDCQRCDVALANFLGAETASVGSCIEFGWCDAYRTPVVMAAEKNNLHALHPMMKNLSVTIAETLEEACHIVNAMCSLEFAQNNI